MNNITNNINGEKGRFEINFEGEPAGLMEYTKDSDSQITITHTEVDEAFGGKGLGGLLVKAAVDYAKENNLKIRPACSFAKHVLEKDNQYRDVLVS